MSEDSKGRELDATSRTRRRYLKAFSGVAGGVIVAGCSGSGGDGGSSGGDGSGSSGGGSSSGSGGGGSQMGDPVSFTLYSWTAQEDQTREIQKMFQELGMQTEFEVLPRSEFIDLTYVEAEPFPRMSPIMARRFGNTAGRVPLSFWLSMYLPDAHYNLNNWESSEYADLYSEWKQTYDVEQRKGLIAQMQDIFLDEVPDLIYHNWPSVQVYNTDRWDLEPSQLLGNRVSALMSMLKISAKTDRRDCVVADTEPFSGANHLMEIGRNSPYYIWKNVFTTMTKLDTNGEFINFGAESIDVVDQTTIDLTLRDDLVFHDGEPVTAEDVAFSYEYFAEKNIPRYDSYAQFIESATAQDDVTTRVKLTQPDHEFVTASTSEIIILPEHHWGDVDNPQEAQFDGMNVGSGPLVAVEAGANRIETKRNPDHWFQVDYDRLIWVARDTLSGIRAGLVEGEIDGVAQEMPPPTAQQIAESNDHLSVISSGGVGRWMITFDLSAKPFDDVNLRRAMKHVIDFEKINQLIWAGLATPGNFTPVWPSHAESQDLPTAVDTYDPDKAKQMLEDAGYVYDDDGVLHYPA